MSFATESSLTQTVFGMVLAASSAISKCNLAQFEHWQPLAAGGAAHSYSATDKSTNRSVVIHTFPWLAARPAGRQALAGQIKLFQSVCGARSRVRFVELDGDRPFVVMDTADDTALDSFADEASGTEQLTWIAEFLHGLNRAFRSRLYHGALNLASIRFCRSPQPLSYIDYLQRFTTAGEELGERSVFELYQSDVSQGLAVVAHVAVRAIQRELFDSVIPPRKLALLKRLCRDEHDAAALDERFDAWLEYFEEWLPQPTASAPASSLAGDVTADIDVCQKWEANSLQPGGSDTFATQVGQATPEQPFDTAQSAGLAALAITGSETTGSTATAPVTADELPSGTMLGRFRVEELIGRGGMGAVYRGIDSSSGSVVALKILRAQGAGAAQAIRRFNKEARILASIHNDHVTQLLEVGTTRGIHYIAMEFVDGIDLKKWLRTRTPLDERSALRITSDIARALVEAHHRNIIHRDIKPENVLLASHVSMPAGATRAELALTDCIIKLTDFGIAREIEQSQSMEVTRAGGLLGTPLYMSPEQCKGGREINAATDIYSLGITLYEMLCGSVPFNDTDIMKLAALHCFEPLTDVRKRNQRVSEATSQLVHRMLAKNANDRPADARQLIGEIERILDGRPSDFESHPRLPQFDSANIWKRVFEWQLQSSPESLWPHVSNTERLNRAVGLPTVQYSTVRDPNLGLRRFGSFRLGGVKIQWEEHPFEWIEGARMGVLREFSTGPFKWFMNTVELRPRADGGTHLVHTVKIEPRNTLGRVVSTIEAGWKGGRALDRVYRRIDESLQSNKSGAERDLFEDAPQRKRNSASRIEARLDVMISKGVELDAAQKLVNYLQSTPVQELSKIRPLQLAQRLGISHETMVDVCLVAAASGILVLQWDVLCPTCRVAAKTESLLADIKQHTECEACDTQFQSNIGNAIEMTFRIHPELREAVAGKYCIGGPWHAPHVVTQIRVAAQERISLSLRLEVGDYLMRSVGTPDSQLISVRSTAAGSRIEFRLPVDKARTAQPSVREGAVEVTLLNELAVPRIFRLERTIERDQVVTAATASTLQRFRELFPEQAFVREAPIVTEDLSLLVLQFQDLGKLYHALGDQEAYDLCQSVLSDAEGTVAVCGGAVVKTSSEGLLASFQDCAAACQAAIDMQQGFGGKYDHYQFTQGVAVHCGRTLIAQQNGRIDYFGATLRTASRLAALAGRAVLLTDAVYADPVVRQLLTERNLEVETLLLDQDTDAPQIVQKIHIGE